MFDNWSIFVEDDLPKPEYDMPRMAPSPNIQILNSDVWQCTPGFMHENNFPNLCCENLLNEYPGETVNREIKLSGLSPYTKEDDVTKACSTYGEVMKVDMSKISHGISIVTYYDLRSASKARKYLPETTICDYQVNCNYALYSVVNSDYKTPMNEGTIVVFHLNTNPSDETILETFEKFGPVRQIRRSPKRDSQRFIEYYDIRHAEQAKIQMHNQVYLGSKLTVDYSLPGGFRKAPSLSTTKAISKPLIVKSYNPAQKQLSL